MIEKDKALNKYKITALILLVVSLAFNILQKPVFNYLVLTGQVMQRPIQIFTFKFFVFVIEAVLFGAYILFTNNKVISKFFSMVLAADIVSRIYSIISWIRLIIMFSNYNSGMKWTKPIINQYITNVLVSVAYLAAFIFLLIDTLKKHKFLKVSRIIMLVIAAWGLLGVIMNFVNNNVLYALVSSYGFFFNLVFLIYYFCIAENRNMTTLESELHRLKTEYEGGNITPEEYANERQNILNSL